MCHNHITYHTCGHPTTHITLCLAAVGPLVQRATIFPFLHALKAVPIAAHEVITSSSQSKTGCQQCIAPDHKPMKPGHQSFFHYSNAYNSIVRDRYTRKPGVVLHLESDLGMTGKDDGQGLDTAYDDGLGGIHNAPVLRDSELLPLPQVKARNDHSGKGPLAKL